MMAGKTDNARASRMTLWAIAAALCLAGATLWHQDARAAIAKAPAKVDKLDNATCLSCHDAGKEKFEIVGSNGEKRPLLAVPADKLAKSVHADMECIACHKEITDSVKSHKIDTTAQKANCIKCHEAL